MSSYVVLSDRQRAPVPFNFGNRRGLPRGGTPGVLPRTVEPFGIVDEHSRYPGDEFDDRIQRDRMPWIPAPYYINPPCTWVNWTESGPIRPTLHMRNCSLRLMEGNSASRNLHDPRNPQRGLHTNPPPAVAHTVARYVSGNAQMQPGRQDRLSASRYTGQSFSQTTRDQGMA